MNPDNPSKCKELMSDGSCMMKTTQAYYDVDNEDYSTIMPVMCPFLNKEK